MRRFVTTFVVCLAAKTAAAAPGDRLEVLVSEARVLGSPVADAEILMRVPRGEPVIERRRWDVWVAVELPRRGQGGWIHTSLLGPPRLTGEPAVESGPDAAVAPEAVTRFRTTLGRANRRHLGSNGPLPFVGARAAGPGVVQVVVRRAWMAQPLATREDELDGLFARWQVVAGGEETLRLEIIDPSGHVLMSRGRPTSPALSLVDEDG